MNTLPKLFFRFVFAQSMLEMHFFQKVNYVTNFISFLPAYPSVLITHSLAYLTFNSHTRHVTHAHILSRDIKLVNSKNNIYLVDIWII